MMSQREIDALRRLLEKWTYRLCEPDWETFDSIFGSRATTLWGVMCQSYDWHNAPEEFPEGEPTGVIIYGR